MICVCVHVYINILHDMCMRVLMHEYRLCVLAFFVEAKLKYGHEDALTDEQGNCGTRVPRVRDRRVVADRWHQPSRHRETRLGPNGPHGQACK